MKRAFVILTLIILLGVFQWAANAQGGETLILNEAKLGVVTADGTTPSYLFNATAGQQAEIEVISLTNGLNLSFTVFSPSGALIVAVGNPAGQSSIASTVTFTENAAYTIQLSASGATAGQFLIMVKSGGLSGEPPIFLGENQSFNDSVNVGSEFRYSFASNPLTPLEIRVISNDPQHGPALSLTTDTGKVLATVSGEVPGIVLRIPPGVGVTYLLGVRNDHPTGQTTAYTISLSPPAEEGALPTGPSGPVVTAEPDDDGLIDLPTTGPCVLATQGQIVNVREGPSTNYDQIDSIGAYAIYNVLGRNSDGSWYQINTTPRNGWVAVAVTRQGGNCNNVPIATYPPLRKSSISGTVWHDLCATPDDPDDDPPPSGCVSDGHGSYRANGIYDSGEPGINGIAVILGSGACPSTGLETIITSSGGRFNFEHLTAGTYCVSVNASVSPNSGILIPGSWTNPLTSSSTASFTVTLGDVDNRTVNFGWDYQYLP